MHCNLNSRAALTAGGEGGLQAPGATTNAEEADTTKEEHPNLMELISVHTKFETAYLIFTSEPWARQNNLQQAINTKKTKFHFQLVVVTKFC